MADDNSIFQEIDESLRVDKLQQFWARSGNLVIAACIGIILLTIASVLWKNHMHEVHAEQTGVILQADKLLQSAQYPDAIKLLQAHENESSELAVIMKLRHADTLSKTGEAEKAFSLYSEIAHDTHADVGLRDLAALQASILADNLHKPFDATKATTDGRPFAAQMQLVKAAELIEDGKNKEAAAILKPLSENIDAPSSQRARAMELLDATGENK